MADNKIQEIKSYIDEIHHGAKSIEGLFVNVGKEAMTALKAQMGASEHLIKFFEQEMEAKRMTVREGTKLIAIQTVSNMLAAKGLSLEETRKNLYAEAARHSGDAVQQLVSLKDTMTNLLNPTTAFAQLVELSSKRFFELDLAAEGFRKTTGLMASETKKIEANVKAFSRDFAEYGVTVESAYKTATALTDTFGDKFMASNKENVKFIGLMAANMGIAEEDSAKIMQNFMGVGNMTAESAQNMELQAASLAKSAGVPLPKVMKAVASASGETLMMLKGNVKELVRGAVEAARLGTTLDQVANAGRQMLNFQESVASEMEASVLFGKNINMQHARELAYRGDIAGLATEQTRIMNSMGDLNKMDVFQQEALAKAMGMTTKELFDRKAKQEELNELKRKEPNLYAEYDKQNQALEDQSKNVVEKYKQDLLNKQVQAEQTKLANSFKQILISISDVLGPIVKLLMQAMNLLTIMIKPITVVLSLFSKIFETIGNIFDYTTWGAGFFSNWTGTLDEMFNDWKKIVGGVVLLGSAIGIYFALVKRGIISNMVNPFKGALTSMTGLFKKFTLDTAGAGGGVTPKIKGGKGGKGGKAGGGMMDGMIESVNKIKPASLLAVAGAMIAFAGAVFIMAKAAETFGSDAAQKGFVNMALAAGILGIFTAVLVASGSAIAAASPALEIAAVVMISFGAALLLMGVAAMAAGKGIDFAADGLVKLASIGFTGLAGVAGGIALLSGALLSFGVAMAGGGLMSFLGGGMLLQLMGLAAISPLLEKTSGALNVITDSLTTFKDKDIVTGISAVTEAIKKLNDELEKTSTMKLMALAAVNVTSAAVAGGGESGNTSQKLDELIGLMKSGAIAVNIDGNRASYLLANNNTKRGGLGAIA